MSASSLSPTRRELIATTAADRRHQACFPERCRRSPPMSSIRHFRINAPEEALIDLRRRIAATKWPGRELVTDASQGVQLATMQKLASCWVNDYDWRKVEAKLATLPQFVTEIDGLDIVHVRSKRENALPLIVTQSPPLLIAAGRSSARILRLYIEIAFRNSQPPGEFWEIKVADRQTAQAPQLFSLVALHEPINLFVEEHTRSPRPFIRTADPDAIVEKVRCGYHAWASMARPVG